MEGPYPRRVHVTDVGPRDGLQNEPRPIPTEAKVAFVRGLVAAGVTDIEVTSFVRPDRVPQLADAREVMAALGPAPEGVTWSALVPNERGWEAAATCGVGKIGVFTAASETFSQRNVNASIAETIERFRPVVRAALAAHVHVRGYVSCAVACPFEGPIEAAAVAHVTQQLLDLGCEEISLGDTIGAGTPADIAALLDVVLAHVDADHLVLHVHDTRGMAVANVVEGMRHGITSFDASAAGLGGCPFAPGASGNLATEDIVFLLDGLGIQHGIDLERLRAASDVLAPHLGHPFVGRVRQAPPLPWSVRS